MTFKCYFYLTNNKVYHRQDKSYKCTKYIRCNKKCKLDPSVDELERLMREEEYLEREEEKALACAVRLYKLWKQVKIKGQNIIIRGIFTIEELEKIEEKERKETKEREKAKAEKLARE